MIKKFDDFKLNENSILTESIDLTDDEKSYLWSKLEYTKKKRAIDQENKLFTLLNGKQKTFDNDDFNTILNSLEFTFRKKLKGIDTPLKNDTFVSILNKIPEDWTGVKYSSISAKRKKDEKEKDDK